MALRFVKSLNSESQILNRFRDSNKQVNDRMLRARSKRLKDNLMTSAPVLQTALLVLLEVQLLA